jgi:hypothetical protein
MKTLPVVGSIVVVNNLPNATFYRVVETDGKFGVGLIDSTIEKQVPNQAVQWIDVGAVKYPTTAQMFSKSRLT